MFFEIILEIGVHSNVRLLHLQHYYNAYDNLITCIKERFDQPDFNLHSQLHIFLSKPENDIPYLVEYNIVSEVCKNDFDSFSFRNSIKISTRDCRCVKSVVTILFD